MLNLIQNSGNTVVFTLSDSITLTATPIYFLFKFKSTTTNQEVLFTAPDQSTNLTRYNKFTFYLTGSSYQNLTAGTVTLNPLGSWNYEVYEQLSQTNLNLTGTSGVVLESGIAHLTGTGLTYLTQPAYTGSSTTYNYYTP